MQDPDASLVMMAVLLVKSRDRDPPRSRRSRKRDAPPRMYTSRRLKTLAQNPALITRHHSPFPIGVVAH